MLPRKPNHELILYLVLPCYNEEETLTYSAEALTSKLTCLIRDEKLISEKSRILFVDDGSKDRTLDMIVQLSNAYPRQICGIHLAHNRGHQNALLAGLMYAKDRCDITISMDADLQQDINAIEDFLSAYRDGCEIVYGVRNSRDTDSFFKKATASAYYSMLKWLGTSAERNAADYRLMSAVSLQALSEYSEVNLFLRGLIPNIGFHSGTVHFNVKMREHGTSKYTLGKMLKLAMDGITSFSIRPIRLILGVGALIFLVSIIMILIFIIDYFCGNTVPGYATLSCSIWFLGGVQLLSIGIIGEYVGRNYEETKKRPRYFIADTVGGEDDDCN